MYDDIREIERKKAFSRGYSPRELQKEIRKYSIRTWAYALAIIPPTVAGMGGAIYCMNEDKIMLGTGSVLLGALLTAGSYVEGKISAIKLDSLNLVKQNLENLVENPQNSEKYWNKRND